MLKPSIEELRELKNTGKYDIAPISMELLSDIRTPVEVLKILLNVSEHCYMFESVTDNEKWGRYSFLGYAPKMEITCANGEMKVGGVAIKTNNPNQYISQVLSEHRRPVIEGFPSFKGGLVG